MKLRSPGSLPWPSESPGYSLAPAPGALRFAATHGGRYRIASLITTSSVVQGFNRTYSGDWTIEAKLGMQAAGTLPRGVIASTITATNAMSFAGRGPRPRIDATIAASVSIRGDLRYRGRYAVSSRTGMRASGTLPRGTLAGTITTGSVIYGRLRGRVGTISSTISVHNHIIANLVGPAVRALHGARFNGVSPKWSLSAVISQPITLSYEGYSITLIPGELGMETRTTHLTVCPFDHIVRFGAKYFGIGPDGVYELTGDTYDGALIASSIETAPDGDSQNMMRPQYLYIGGRLSDDFIAGVKVGETGEYNVGSTVRSGTRNHRVKFGSGVKSRYLAYTFDNPSGADFQIDDMTPKPKYIKRTMHGVE